MSGFTLFLGHNEVQLMDAISYGYQLVFKWQYNNSSKYIDPRFQPALGESNRLMPVLNQSGSSSTNVRQFLHQL
jgi:hypothetical protein